jgi:hypothetical protein
MYNFYIINLDYICQNDDLGIRARLIHRDGGSIMYQVLQKAKNKTQLITTQESLKFDKNIFLN